MAAATHAPPPPLDAIPAPAAPPLPAPSPNPSSSASAAFSGRSSTPGGCVTTFPQPPALACGPTPTVASSPADDPERFQPREPLRSTGSSVDASAAHEKVTRSPPRLTRSTPSTPAQTLPLAPPQKVLKTASAAGAPTPPPSADDAATATPQPRKGARSSAPGTPPPSRPDAAAATATHHARAEAGVAGPKIGPSRHAVTPAVTPNSSLSPEPDAAPFYPGCSSGGRMRAVGGRTITTSSPTTTTQQPT